MDIGGAETHIIELARELIARGHTACVVSAGGAFEPELLSFGAAHVWAPLDKKDPISVLRSRSILDKLVKSGEYDVVHAHARIAAAICEPICRKHDVRFVTTAHWVFSTAFIWRSLTKWGEHTFAVSDDIVNYLRLNYGVATDNITVIPNGINRAKFTFDKTLRDKKREELGVGSSKVVLHISRLGVRVSSCAETLLSLCEELQENDDYVFVFVGDGSERETLEKRAERINKKKGRRVAIFAGGTSDVLPYLCAADVFIGPSRAALEAMSVGLPVIIAGSEGYMGRLTDDNFDFARETNLCCRSGDIPSWQMLLGDVRAVDNMTDDEKRSLLSVQERLLSNYTVERMTDLCESEYLRMSKLSTRKAPLAVVCGYYGFKNAGDEAMLGALVRGVRRNAHGAPLCIMSNSPRKTSREHVVSSVHRYNIFRIAKELQKSGFLIFGGGNLLQDKTSKRSLAYYKFILRLAKHCGAKIAVYSNGLGPLSTGASRRIVPLLKGAEHVSMRDGESYDFCIKNGIDAIRVADPAFSLEKRRSANERSGYFIVVPKKERDTDESDIYNFTEYVRLNYGFTPVFAAMYSSEDKSLCQRLAKKCKGVLLENGASDYGIMSSYLGGAEFVVASRLHALVCACTVSCPMISVGAGKLSSFMSDIGMSKCAVSSFGGAREIVDPVVKSSEEIRASLKEASARMKDLSEKELERISDMMK